MPKVQVLPHPQLCPQGAEFELAQGEVLAQGLLDHKVNIEHACDLSCACTTCHVIVRQGGASLEAATDREEDMLDRAWGLTAQSRLSCQIKVGTQPLVIEIPKYTINHARENY